MSPWMYDDPAEMDYDHIDAPIRELVKEINDSGWLLTEESCAGHPANEPSAWGGNGAVYLRVVMKEKADLFYLLFLMDKLHESTRGMLYWNATMSYDRSDELGSHWYINFNYSPDISHRSIAVDAVLRAVVQVNIMKKHAPRENP